MRWMLQKVGIIKALSLLSVLSGFDQVHKHILLIKFLRFKIRLVCMHRIGSFWRALVCSGHIRASCRAAILEQTSQQRGRQLFAL